MILSSNRVDDIFEDRNMKKVFEEGERIKK